MDLNQTFKEQQNATKWKMATYFVREDWLSKTKERQMEIIRDVHRGIGDSEHSKEHSHRGKNTTYDKIAQKIFWHHTAADIKEYVKSCEQCLK